MSAELVLPSAVLKLNASSTLACFSHNDRPSSGDFLVGIRFGIVVLRVVPCWEVVDELGDTVEVAERGRRLHLIWGEEVRCKVSQSVEQFLQLWSDTVVAVVASRIRVQWE